MNILVIGVGNEFRGDDAVGLLVARQLDAQNLPWVTVIEQSGEGSDLIDAWEGYKHVILIDAVQSGADPGTIHRFQAHGDNLPAYTFKFSSHAFGVAEAIEIAHSLGDLPPDLLIFGIEGENFNHGSLVSMAVHHAIDQVFHLIRNQIEQIQRD